MRLCGEGDFSLRLRATDAVNLALSEQSGVQLGLMAFSHGPVASPACKMPIVVV